MVLLDLSAYTDLGLLTLRLFLGFIMVVHGTPKLMGPAWQQMRVGMTQMSIPGALFDFAGLLKFSAELLWYSAYWLGLLPCSSPLRWSERYPSTSDRSRFWHRSTDV
jgi:uncharacterized membrane protein YphA (DoxX/SURF4 family)